jgi:hypothetical protein
LRNYYAARLALTRHGNIPTLDLERYAVIDGRQDRRVQLPLPVPGHGGICRRTV